MTPRRGRVALAWLPRRADVVLPLPGAPVPEEGEEDLAALGLRLSAAEAARLTVRANTSS